MINSQHKKAMILLHGRGSTSENILPLGLALADDTFYFSAPQAPHGSWYPYSFMADEKMNEPYLSQSLETLRNLIEEISPNIPKSQIYIVGFSQGACLALEISARFASRYAGIIAFTGGLIGKTLNENKYHGNFEGTPVFIGNSDIDPHVPLSRSEESKKIMEKLGARVTLKVYPGMPHTVSQEEIAWVKENMIIK